MRFYKFLGIVCLLSLLSGCGFHLPNQNRLGNSLSAVNVMGDYRSKYYRMVIQKLEVRGVKVYYQGTQNSKTFKEDETIPTISITNPRYSLPIASIDSRTATKEYEMIISTQAMLKIPNHRSIVIRNGLTRTLLYKSANSLASDVDRLQLIDETYDILAEQLINRINYLGKHSDPDEPRAVPAELLLAKDENNDDIYIDNSRHMTLIDALTSQNLIEEVNAPTTTIDELNNGAELLKRDYSLPKTAPRIKNEAPSSISEEGFLKTTEEE